MESKADLIMKLRAVMPEQSPVNITRHAQIIANTVLRARALRSGVAAGTGTVGDENVRKLPRHATPDPHRASEREAASPKRGMGSS